jgi:hypothetical protein
MRIERPMNQPGSRGACGGVAEGSLLPGDAVDGGDELLNDGDQCDLLCSAPSHPEDERDGVAPCRVLPATRRGRVRAGEGSLHRA